MGLDGLQDPARIARELESAVYHEPVAVRSIEVVRNKPGRRCTLRYELEVGAPPHGRCERLYAKTYASERGRGVYERTRALAAASPLRSRAALPTPIAYVPSLRALFQQEVPGEPIVPALLAGDRKLAARVADVLHALHASELDLTRRHTLETEVERLGERVALLAAADPDLAPAAEPCLARISEAARGRWCWRFRPVHRDFYHDQVLVGDHGLSLLDLDDAAMSEPALDVANFLAHLTLLSLQERGVPGALAGVACAFRERALALDPGLDHDLLRLLEAGTLLRLAQIHLPRARGAQVAAGMLEECKRTLDSLERLAVGGA